MEIIHLSDSHIGPEPDFNFKGVRTLERFRTLLDAVLALPFRPDAVVHTGDVANHPSREAYALAGAEMARLDVPVYYACGNHDDAGMMGELLSMGATIPLVDAGSPLAYRVEGEDTELVVIDASDPEKKGAWGEVPPNQLDALEGVLGAEGRPVALFCHFPALPVGCRWMDEHLLLRNGERLHGILRDAGPARVRGMFFGHVHHGIQISREGVTHCGVGSVSVRFDMNPADRAPVFEPAAPAFFNHISFGEKETIVRQHSLDISD
ncbi:MAG: metallophosphoesterase [Verrucomicrobiales bacterium]